MTRVIVIGLLVCFLSLACVLGVAQQKAITPSKPSAHTIPPVGSTETAVPSPPPTWTTYTNGNYVNDLAVDREGNLWAATFGGLVKWTVDGVYEKFTTADGLPDNNVGSVAVAPDGTVWLGFFEDGLAAFDGTDPAGPKIGRTFTTADGLPDDHVRDVAVAPDGTVWFSTYGNVITRFDGASWTTYTTMDGLPGGSISADISVAPDGTVWVYTRGEISCFDGQTTTGETWTPYIADGLSSGDVQDISVATDGTIWIATAGCQVARLDNTRWITYTVGGGIKNCPDPNTIAAAPGSALWVGTQGGGLFYFDSTKPAYEAWVRYTERDGLLSNTIDDIAIAPDGAAWTGSWPGRGISRVERASSGTSKCTTYVTDDDLPIQWEDIVMTSDGMLWFFPEESDPSCFDPSASGGTPASGRGGEWVTCPGTGLGVTIEPSITQASDGSLWTLAGITDFNMRGFVPNVAHFDGTSWTVYRMNDSPATTLGNLTIAPDGSAWVGVYDHPVSLSYRGLGVARFEGSNAPGAEWTLYTTKDGLADNMVYDIDVATDGSLWFATREGVSRFESAGTLGSNWTTYDIDTLLPDIDDSSHTSWPCLITTPAGLMCYEVEAAVTCFNGETWTAYYKKADGFLKEPGRIIHILLNSAVDQDGTLWVGIPSGLAHFDGTTWMTYTAADDLLGHDIHAVAVASDGAVWVGTSNGAARFDGAAWTTYTTADGLADNYVADIFAAPDGSTWFVTDGSVSRFDGATWTTYTTADSLVNINIADIFAAPDGSLWFVTDSNLSRYGPPK
jgi:ligand-binding sensor domain-containing protein